MGYEVWDLEHSALPVRSELYCLNPVNLETPFTESLTSYIARLAEHHCLSVRDLVIKKMLPLLDRPYLSGQRGHDNITAFWKDTPTLNGANILTADWVRVVEELTLRRGLHCLTMLSWADSLSFRGLIRRTQAWCPLCYEEWRGSGQPVYNPLLWSLEVISTCSLHATPLQHLCPHEDCRQPQTMLTSRSRLGYCSQCGRWLGLQQSGETLSVTVGSYHEDQAWRQWVAKEVGELIASAPTLPFPPQKVHFAQVVEAYLDGMAGGNVSAVSRFLLVSRRTIRDWKKGEQIPQLVSLLQFCYLCNISPIRLLTEDLLAAGIFGTRRDLSTESRYKAKKRYRVFDAERMRRALEAQLQIVEYPPPPMSVVAKRLGYDQSFLYKYFPDLCSSISAKHEKYRTSKREERKRQLVLEVRQATLRVHSQGMYPSQLRVRNSLTKPGSMRIPDALHAWHATLEELGWM